MNSDIDKQMESQFSGNFLDASDILNSGDITVTICDVVGPNIERDATKKVIDKAIVAFSGAKKRLILNKTNAKIIRMHHGNPSEWSGKKITLTVRWLEKAFGQLNVPVIRVVPPSDKPMTFGMRQKFGAETSFTAQKQD
jgi:hypothetical protein